MSADDLAVSSHRPEAAGSVRVRVARAALEAALHAPGVVGSDPGPSRLRVTADPTAGPLIGVSATAQTDGRYAVDLSLVADMVPLHELAEQVRQRVRKRTRDEHLEEVLGSINVEFAYLMTREERAAAAEKEVEEARTAEKLAPADATAAPAPEPTVTASAPESGRGAEAVGAQTGAGLASGEGASLGEPSAEAPPPGRDSAVIAVRQAALATDQAALAAKQAALAAEQAALTAEPDMALPHERAPKEQEE